MREKGARGTNQISRLCIFLWGFLKTPLRSPNTAVALIYKCKDVVLVFCLKFGKNRVAGVRLSGCEELCLQPLSM
jgi:hypothetical protein